jgi:hypothetical protein
MVYLTPTDAKEVAFDFVTEATEAFLIAADFPQVELRYQGKPDVDRSPDMFVFFSMQQVQSPLRAFVNTEDGIDTNVYETSGLIFAQVNVVMTFADGFHYGDLLATAIRNILRDADASGMKFLNARFNELPNTVEYFKWNVVAEYEYDERNVS